MSSTNSHDFSQTALDPVVSKRRKHAPAWRRREVHVLLLAALLLALLAFLALASSEADEGDVIVASANSAQNSHSATLLSDGRVLVAGGWSGTTAIATSNNLSVGAYRLLAPWVDSQGTWTQRMTGTNWVVPGLGSGSDYAAAGGGASAVLGDGGSWVEVDVTEMAQAWVDNPSQNYGLLLRQALASGYVIYDFCSERGVSPCAAAQAPQLTVWHR